MRPKKLTAEQIELGARFLAMSNICTIDQYRKQIVDLSTLKRYTHAAWEDAVQGFMESQEGGYDDRHESAAIKTVELEIRSFRNDLKQLGKKRAYWLEILKKEVPFLFVDEPTVKVRQVGGRRHSR